jgi:AraC-like DNA-binding protein
MLRSIHLQSSISIRYAVPALRELERLGYSRRDLFAELDIPISDNNLQSDDLVLPVLEFRKLYGYALALLEKETSNRDGLDVSHIERLETMCFVAIACPDLRTAIDRIAAVFRISLPHEFSINLEQIGDSARLEIELNRSRSDTATMIVTLASMSFFYQLFSWLTGTRMPLSQLAFRAPEVPESAPVMAGMLRAPYIFGQSSNAMLFNVRYLDQPVVRTYYDLVRVIDFMPVGLAYSDSNDAMLTTRIRAMLMFALQNELPLMSAADAAEELHMSEAKFRRSLRAEGTAYADIKSHCQRELAQDLLSHTDVPVSEIAIRIGFNEDRAFRRAFRQWTGVSPSEYRDAVRSK